MRAAMTHLFIVARDQTDLYRYLVREFAEEEGVRVLLDRRSGVDRRSGGDRRDAPRPVADRRQGERRNRPAVLEQLRALGYAFVRVG